MIPAIQPTIINCEKALEAFGREISALEGSTDALSTRLDTLLLSQVPKTKEDLQTIAAHIRTFEKKLLGSNDLTSNQLFYFQAAQQKVTEKHERTQAAFQKVAGSSPETASKPIKKCTLQPAPALDTRRYTLIALGGYGVFTNLLLQANNLKQKVPNVAVKEVASFEKQLSTLESTTQSFTHFTQKSLDLTRSQKLLFSESGQSILTVLEGVKKTISQHIPSTDTPQFVFFADIDPCNEKVNELRRYEANLTEISKGLVSSEALDYSALAEDLHKEITHTENQITQEELADAERFIERGESLDALVESETLNRSALEFRKDAIEERKNEGCILS